MTMRLSTALLATLPRREFAALIASGCISKGDLRAINGLRAGDQTGAVAKRKVYSAVKKQCADIYRYAQKRFAEGQKQETSMVTTTDDLVAERVGKSRDTQAMLRDAVAKDQRANPGRRKADSIDKVLLGPVAKEMRQLELRLDELTKAKKHTAATRSHDQHRFQHSGSWPHRLRLLCYCQQSA
jgi:hypothetical protein